MDAKSYERYSRQILFNEIGEAGQQRLLESSAVIVGCGALGTALANLLVRAGVGKLRIVDRDFVEPSNLQRQTCSRNPTRRKPCPRPWPQSAACGPLIPGYQLRASSLTLAQKMPRNYCTVSP